MQKRLAATLTLFICLSFLLPAGEAAADRDNYDLYFPMGLLHYHIDQLPGLTRFLSSLLITAGDHHKGIQEMELAMRKGDLLRELARAGDCFQKVLKDTAPYNARVRASALLRLGMIHDSRKERKRAEEYYNRALEVDGGEGVAQVDARCYLKTPYIP